MLHLIYWAACIMDLYIVKLGLSLMALDICCNIVPIASFSAAFPWQRDD